MDNELAQGGNVIPFPSRFDCRVETYVRELAAELRARAPVPGAVEQIDACAWRVFREFATRHVANPQDAPTAVELADFLLNRAHE